MTFIETHVVDPTDPTAFYLLDMLQSEYVGLYGFPDPNPEGGLDRAMPPNGGVIVMTEVGHPIAVGGWTPLDPLTACLRRMYVHYRYRRQGHSKTLLHAIENHAREQGMTRIVLETGDAQTTAIALYTSMGYTPTEPFGYYKDAHDSVFLGCDL